MKKIISSKPSLVSYSFSIPIVLAFSIIGLGLGIFGPSGENVFGFLLFGFFFSLFCFMVWSLNRAACVVWVEEGTVRCKGLIWGFYKECPVSSILKVKVKYRLHEVGFNKSFIYLVNDRTQEYKKFLRIRKDSYICFRKTKKNLDFLRTFWSGTIENS